MNYIDIVLLILLGLAFLRGFAAGVWKSIMNLLTTAAAFLLAFLLAGPTVRWLDARFGTLTSVSNWTRNVFPSLPGISEPYAPATFERVFEGLGESGWAGTFRKFLQGDLSGAASLAGPDPTWGDVLAFGISHLFLSGIAFLILLALFSSLGTLLVKTLGFALPASLGARLLGGIIQVGLSSIWLSILAGTLYPAFTGGFLKGASEAASNSWVLALLLGIYRSIWPLIVAKIQS
ncbi:MAG: CvpA family protein [Bacillota bacterium]